MNTESVLTSEERALLNLLADGWNQFVKLPVQHPSHNREFEGHLHELQRLIMSRPISRAEGWVKNVEQDRSAENMSPVFENAEAVSTGMPAPRAEEGHSYVFGVDWGNRHDIAVISIMDVDAKRQVYVEAVRNQEVKNLLLRVSMLADRWHPRIILAGNNSVFSVYIEALQQHGLPVQGLIIDMAMQGTLIETLAYAIKQNDVLLLLHQEQLYQLVMYKAAFVANIWKFISDGDSFVKALALAFWAAKWVREGGSDWIHFAGEAKKTDE